MAAQMVKKDGRTEPFQRQKTVNVSTAVGVPADVTASIADEVEKAARDQMPTSEIRSMVLERLDKIEQDWVKNWSNTRQPKSSSPFVLGNRGSDGVGRMYSRIIALLSDLGTRDYFVGAIKGAILSVNPEAEVVDLTHAVPKRDVRTAAFVLVHAAETFPPGSIFIAVVDPGVGTKRKCIILQTKNGLSFVGPDNGIFTLAAERFGTAKIYEITNRALMRPQISPTFHGRDVMAPVAAHLSAGLDPAEVGPQLKTLKRLKIPRPRLVKGKIRGCVLNVDDFGNVITNIGSTLISPFTKLGERLEVKIGNRSLDVKFVRTFGDVGAGELLCCVGSAGLLELARNRGNLAGDLKVKVGARISIWK